MSSFKEKSQVFIIGLMIGLIVAGGFFIFKLDDYFKELNFYKNLSKTFHSDAKSDESLVKAEDKTLVKEKKLKENLTQNKSDSGTDSSNVKVSNTDFVLSADTLNNRSVKDTLIEKNIVTEDIVVRKDELLSTKTLEIINFNPTANRLNSKDSLLQKVSGIKDDRNNAKQFLNV